MPAPKRPDKRPAAPRSARALELHADGVPLAEAARRAGVSRQATYKRMRSTKGQSLALGQSSGDPDLPLLDAISNGSAGPPAGQAVGDPVQGVEGSIRGERAPTPATPPGYPTVAQLRKAVVDAALADEAGALAAYSRHVLKAHRARSRQLWARLQQLAAREDLGAGARGSPASALAALAGAHARLVDADRTILGMRDGQTTPAAADDAPAPVVGLVATVTPDQFRQLAAAHNAGQLVTAEIPSDGAGLEGDVRAGGPDTSAGERARAGVRGA